VRIDRALWVLLPWRTFLAGVSANLEYQCVKPVRLAVTDPLLYEACKPDNGFGSRGGNVWRVSHEGPR